MRWASTTGREHFLYRAFAADGSLLYVGLLDALDLYEQVTGGAA